MDDVNGAATAEVCEHYWAWVSPAGTNKSARICMLCHDPDPAWLNHIAEVDLGDGCSVPDCVNCEYGEKRCSTCGMAGGPWPKGDRPKSTRAQSGCPRCGWCY